MDTAKQAQLLSVTEAANQLRVSRGMIFKLLKQRKLRAVKIGTRTLIAARELNRFVSEAQGAAA
jgi:excisionase family DNA binding protein